jgi:hypothetical protein
VLNRLSSVRRATGTVSMLKRALALHGSDHPITRALIEVRS